MFSGRRGGWANRASLWRALPILTAALVPALVPAVADAGAPQCAGAPGAGDPYFPAYGNGGYNVRHYDLDLSYDPATDQLAGNARIEAKAKQDLCSFNLDLAGLEVTSVSVAGKDAAWTRNEGELTVTPRHPLDDRAKFRVAVRYDGVPEEFHDPVFFVPIGFTKTSDGANAVGQPESAAGWFPVNDHPRDKASYSFEVTVPAGYEVVANGRPTARSSARVVWTAWRWEAREPMASYLATIDIGQWDVVRWRTDSGSRSTTRSTPRSRAASGSRLIHRSRARARSLICSRGASAPTRSVPSARSSTPSARSCSRSRPDPPGLLVDLLARLRQRRSGQRRLRPRSRACPPVVRGQRRARSLAGHLAQRATDEFIALAESVSGRQLDDLFNAWLFTPERPERPTATERERAGRMSPAASESARAWLEATSDRLRQGRY